MKQVSNNSKVPLGSFVDSAKAFVAAKSPKTTPQNTIFEQDGSYFVARNDDGLVVERYFVLSDGKVAGHYKYEYDENGNMIRKLHDYDGAGAGVGDPDGVADTIITYEYDENGNKIRDLFDHSGGGADGKVPDGVADYVTYYIRNEKGELTHLGYDEDANGVIDRFCER